jgi:hypothetical protein
VTERADKIEQRGAQFCAVSADGSRSFGCYDTEAEARERLRQVEAAKLADSLLAIREGNAKPEQLKLAIQSLSRVRPDSRDAADKAAVDFNFELAPGLKREIARDSAKASAKAIRRAFDDRVKEADGSKDAKKINRVPEDTISVNGASTKSDLVNSTSRADGSVFRVDRIGVIHTDRERRDGILAETTPEGFLKCDALLTRTGVFEYMDSEGNAWGEYRDAAEVFDADSLNSFSMVVITDDHPAEMVTTDNVKDVQVGHVGSDVRRDGDFVRASLIITDPQVIRSIQDGKVELSCGYFAQVVQDSGVAPDGTPYTSRQTDIRGNHLALVDEGRAGPACRILLDSGGAISKQDSIMPKKKKEEQKHVDARVIVGGEEFDVPDEVAAAMAQMTEKLEAQGAELERLKAPAAEEPEEMGDMEGEGEESSATSEPEPPVKEEDEMKNDAADKMQAVLDAMQAKIDGLESKLKASESTQGARIDARVRLVADCQRILGKDVKTDGVDPLELKKQVIAKVDPEWGKKCDGKSPEYIEAAYEMALENEAKRVDSSAELLAVTAPTQLQDTGATSVADAYKAMQNRFKESYRKAPKREEMN